MLKGESCDDMTRDGISIDAKPSAMLGELGGSFASVRIRLVRYIELAA